MNRILITAVLAASGTLTWSSTLLADHERLLRQDYEVKRTELRNEYRTLREENKYAFHRKRDRLHAERTRAIHIDCPDTRARLIQAINRRLATVSRDFARQNREIARWYHQENDVLRRAYRHARERARLASRPVFVDTLRPSHGADCECNICDPPPIIEEPAVCSEQRVAPVYPVEYLDQHHVRVNRRRKPTALDIAEIVLSLIR